MNNAFCMNLFGRYQGKPFLQIDSHLIAKTTDSTGAGTIMFLHAGIYYMLKEFKILLHVRKLIESNEVRTPCSTAVGNLTIKCYQMAVSLSCSSARPGKYVFITITGGSDLTFTSSSLFCIESMMPF